MPVDRPHPLRPATGATSRRALLGGSAALTATGLLGGCEADLTPGDPPEPGSTAAGVDADTVLADEVRADALALAAWTADAARQHPERRRHWTDLTAMHRAHARALTPGGEPADDEPADDEQTAGPAPSDAIDVWRAARAREQAHQDRLVAAAAAAAGGRLARLFAAMAAAVAQRLAAWPPAPRRAPSGDAS